MAQTHCSLTMQHTHQPQNRFRKKNQRCPTLIDFVSVRLVSFVSDNKGIVSRVTSMACHLSILRLCRATLPNVRIACVAVSNLGIWALSCNAQKLDISASHLLH